MNTLNGVKFVHEQIEPNTILPAAAKRPMNEIKDVPSSLLSPSVVAAIAGK